MIVLNYFIDGDARAPREETIPEPEDDKPSSLNSSLLLGFGCLRTLPSLKFF
jgi:hypothetical protein